MQYIYFIENDEPYWYNIYLLGTFAHSWYPGNNIKSFNNIVCWNGGKELI